MKTYCRIGCVVVLLSLFACNSKQVEYIPFQESEGGYWGLVDTKGNVLFSEEFVNPILNISEGILLTTDSNGNYEFYTVEKRPKYITGNFIFCGRFNHGVAPVVLEGEWIKVINKDGEIVFELKEIEGKSVKSLSEFRHGLATYYLEDETCGLIDSKGKIIVTPQLINDIELISRDVVCVHKDGNYLLFSLKDFVDGNWNNVLANMEGYGSSRKWGYYGSKKEYFWVSSGSKLIITKNGELVTIITLCSDIAEVDFVLEKYFIYTDKKQKKGIMDLKGNIIVRPKYKYLQPLSEKTFLCSNNKKKYKKINLKGDVLEDDFLPFVVPNAVGNEENLIYANNGDYIYCVEDYCAEAYFTNKKGKVRKIIECNSIGWKSYSWRSPMTKGSVRSDFLEIDKLIEKLDITLEGVAGVNLDLYPFGFLNQIIETKEQGLQEGDYDEYDLVNYVLYENSDKDYLEMYKSIDWIMIKYRAELDSPISTLVSHEEYDFGWQEPVLNDSCKMLELDIMLDFAVNPFCRDKVEQIYKGLCEYFKEHNVTIGNTDVIFSSSSMTESDGVYLYIQKPKNCSITLRYTYLN